MASKRLRKKVRANPKAKRKGDEELTVNQENKAIKGKSQCKAKKTNQSKRNKVFRKKVNTNVILRIYNQTGKGSDNRIAKSK